MKYHIQRMDGRFRYRNWFQYYIGFSGRMSDSRGPENFNRVQRWFIDTYGWSAEVRQYDEMYKWNSVLAPAPLMSTKGGWTRPKPKELPPDCNPNWSWSNGCDDLRIYLQGQKELNLFQLKWSDNQ